MKIKKEYVILAAIILALTVYLFSRNPDRIHYRVPEVSGVSKDHISKIEIKRDEGTIVLIKKDNKWHVVPQGYPADADKVKNMLEIIDKLSLTALVSESRNYERYDLGNDKKISVRAWTGENLRREFYVGKTASSYRHTFVKLAGDYRVYHARDNFRAKFAQTVHDLRDKTVLSFEQGEIQEIHITKGNESAGFTRKQALEDAEDGQELEREAQPAPKVKTAWQDADGKKGDESILKRLLTSLSSLHCERYIDDRKKDAFTNPVYVFRLKGAKEYILTIFAKMHRDEKNYPAISSENDYPFLLPDRKAKDLMPSLEELVAKTQ